MARVLVCIDPQPLNDGTCQTTAWIEQPTFADLLPHMADADIWGKAFFLRDHHIGRNRVLTQTSKGKFGMNVVQMRARTSGKFNRLKATALALVVSLAPVAAFAQATADFDPSVVTGKITTYVGYGIVMIAAWILGKWTLKSLGVIGGK